MRVPRRVMLMATLASAVLAPPTAADAQVPGVTYRIGYLGFSQPRGPVAEGAWDAWVQELRGQGFGECQNLVIERRFSEGREDRHAAFAAELVQMKVDLIVALGTAAAQAAKGATSTIPIVINVGNAERTGLVASLARPGGNLTGVSSQVGGETSGKSLQLLREALPRLSRIALLWNSDNPASAITSREGEDPAARALGLTLVAWDIRDPADLEPALAAVARDQPQLLVVHTVLAPYRARILEYAAAHRVPVFSPDASWVQAGALMSYAPNWVDVSRRVALYVARILKGAKPADLPVEQPATFELVVNLRTGKALGLTIPPSVLARADRVIE